MVNKDVYIAPHLVIVYHHFNINIKHVIVRQPPRTGRLANDLNGTREQKRGLGGVNLKKNVFVSHDTPAVGIKTLESRIPVPGFLFTDLTIPAAGMLSTRLKRI